MNVTLVVTALAVGNAAPPARRVFQSLLLAVLIAPKLLIDPAERVLLEDGVMVAKRPSPLNTYMV